MSHAAAWPASAFWDFSVAFYAEPGVSAACLALQDEAGHDVNLILAAAWLALDGRELASKLASALRALGEEHQARVIRPLRRARRGIEAIGVPGRLLAARDRQRRAIGAAELDCEHLEQLALEALIAAARPGPAAGEPPVASLFRVNLGMLYPATAQSIDEPLESAIEAIAHRLARR